MPFFSGPVKRHLSNIFWVCAEQFAVELPKYNAAYVHRYIHAFNISVLFVFILSVYHRGPEFMSSICPIFSILYPESAWDPRVEGRDHVPWFSDSPPLPCS